jgi:hypothetical protein
MLNDLSAPTAPIFQYVIAYIALVESLTFDLGRICEVLAFCTVLPSQR